MDRIRAVTVGDDQPDPGWAWWELMWPASAFCADYAEVE